MAGPELQQVLQMLRARRVESDRSVEEMRAEFDAVAALFPVPADVQRATVSADGVPAEWQAAPDAASDRVVLYLHGGGYGIGSIASHRHLTARLSRAAEARVLSIDYRLAPEHPFPAAVDDAVTAYRWLLGQGFNPSRIVIAGDSAGGGLTLATLVALRDAGVPLPAAGACISPWVDLEGLGESMTTRAALDPMIQREPLLRTAAAYLGGADPRSPLAAPLYADAAGLPPLLLQVGTSETLLDDSVRFAERATAAGVDVTLEPWEEMIHVWHMFADLLPEGQQAIERMGDFIKKHTA
jgi:acetyl esterase/lipase